jgi:hypothetical protein
MALGSGDVLLYESNDAGSKGGGISATTITSAVANNLIDDITNSQRVAGGTVYFKTFFKNNSGTDSALTPVIYAPVLPTNMTLSLGLGFDSASDNDSAQGNMSGFAADNVAGLVSDGTDTRTVTIYGLDDSGTPVPTTENVVLTSASEVLSSTTWSAIWGFYVDNTDGSRTVTLKEGSGGTTRGTIGPNKKAAWLWVVGPSTKSGGILLPNLAAGANYGVWMRLVWTASVGSVRPNTMTLQLEENS